VEKGIAAGIINGKTEAFSSVLLDLNTLVDPAEMKSIIFGYAESIDTGICNGKNTGFFAAINRLQDDEEAVFDLTKKVFRCLNFAISRRNYISVSNAFVYLYDPALISELVFDLVDSVPALESQRNRDLPHFWTRFT
jgi:hypothetical protein